MLCTPGNLPLFLTTTVILTSACAMAAAAAPTTTPASDGSSAFFRAQLADAYERVGRRDPKWDAPARELLQLAVARWSRKGEVDPNLDWRIKLLGDQAVGAGCDDPMVIYHYVRASASLGIEKQIYYGGPFVQNVVDSKYSPYLKIFALTRAAEALAENLRDGTPGAADAMHKLIQQINDNIPLALADPTHCRHIAEVLIDLSTVTAQTDGDRKPSCDAMLAMMKKALPDSAVPDYFEGMFYCKYAWDARGNGFAADVTDQGAKLFDERLKIAAADLAKAVEKDQHLAGGWSEMLTVLLGMDQGRDTMENFFHQAIAEDPDLSAAYHKKLYYLMPKWHGSSQEQIKFGQECLATGKWDSRIPFLLLESHANLYESRWRELNQQSITEKDVDEAREQAQKEFYQRVPAAWEDARMLYEGYLAHDPGAVVDRTRYARLALIAGHPEIAQKQLQILGDDVVTPVFGSGAELRAFREAVQDALDNLPATEPAQ